MKNLKFFFIIFFIPSVVFSDAFEMNRKIGRGINMGNMLEAPKEGEWGVVLKEEYFDIIKKRGFQSVRIPIRWSTEERTSRKKPYKISEDFFRRIDRALDRALSLGLTVIINCHHYDELFRDPDSEEERFKAIWEQIAARYKNRPNNLYFEILNEPNGRLDAARWNKLYQEVLKIIRRTNPDRIVVIGTSDWGGIGGLRNLKLPLDDKNIIVTIHYYNPFSFTHQGAEWVGEQSKNWLGTKWTGDYFEKIAVISEMEVISDFSKKNNVPIFIGEFGSYEKADIKSRQLWTAFCARTFERFNFSWAYWEFCSGFGAYDSSLNRWREEIASSLISDDTSVLTLPPPPEIKGRNIVMNGDFSEKTQNWTFGAWVGKAEGYVTNGAFKVVIQDAGKENWNIQLLQTGLNLKNGKSYLVTFEAWAECVRNFSSGIENSENYSGYGNSGELFAGPEKKTYLYKFTKYGNDPKGRISFSFGGDPTTIWIDNVKVIEIE